MSLIWYFEEAHLATLGRGLGSSQAPAIRRLGNNARA